MRYLLGRTLWREVELEGVRELEMKRKKKKKAKAQKSKLSFADEEEEGLDAAEEEGAGPHTTPVHIRPLPTAPACRLVPHATGGGTCSAGQLHSAPHSVAPRYSFEHLELEMLT
jgi:hypothetical protein